MDFMLKLISWNIVTACCTQGLPQKETLNKVVLPLTFTTCTFPATPETGAGNRFSFIIKKTKWQSNVIVKMLTFDFRKPDSNPGFK